MSEHDLSKKERNLLRIFRQFLMTPGKMLCLNAPQIKTYRTALNTLIEKDLLVKEKFKGGYSLTHDGFTVMKTVTSESP